MHFHYCCSFVIPTLPRNPSLVPELCAVQDGCFYHPLSKGNPSFLNSQNLLFCSFLTQGVPACPSSWEGRKTTPQGAIDHSNKRSELYSVPSKFTYPPKPNNCSLYTFFPPSVCINTNTAHKTSETTGVCVMDKLDKKLCVCILRCVFRRAGVPLTPG